VLRKLSEFLCSTNVGPVFYPTDRPATGAGSMYGRYVEKSVQFEAQTVGRWKSPIFFFENSVGQDSGRMYEAVATNFRRESSTIVLTYTEKIKKPLHENFHFGADKFLTRRLLRTVSRKLSEFLCSTNVGPVFFPIHRPATGAGSTYGR